MDLEHGWAGAAPQHALRGGQGCRGQRDLSLDIPFMENPFLIWESPWIRGIYGPAVIWDLSEPGWWGLEGFVG